MVPVPLKVREITIIQLCPEMTTTERDKRLWRRRQQWRQSHWTGWQFISATTILCSLLLAPLFACKWNVNLSAIDAMYVLLIRIRLLSSKFLFIRKKSEENKINFIFVFIFFSFYSGRGKIEINFSILFIIFGGRGADSNQIKDVIRIKESRLPVQLLPDTHRQDRFSGTEIRLNDFPENLGTHSLSHFQRGERWGSKL